MKKALLVLLCLCGCNVLHAQVKPTELYELVKQLLYDSTGYENVGDWAVGKPKKFPVAWKADKIEMSNDTSINFYRTGSADILLNGRRYFQGSSPIKWSIMLKGPRMGYVSFSIISTASKELNPAMNIDSVFGQKLFKATLLSSCNTRNISGYYYYQLKLPKKDLAFLKLSWLSVNGSTALRIDGYDSWSRYAVKLDCPK